MPRAELARQIGYLRAQGRICVPPVKREPPKTLDYMGTYPRPCFICERVGDCGHREPMVEAALLSVAKKYRDPVPRSLDQQKTGAQGQTKG